ncbi:complement factor H-like [Brachionichthys hirsutus]|uniref:complement factor H-like n=1 Tax=Brachionichthys hirsutus TaxID=412623 RepID=UPI0036049B6F
MDAVAQTLVLFLWVHSLTSVTSQDCTLQEFLNSREYDGNFDTANLQDNYPSGQQVRVGCNVGYSGFFKLICTQRGWTSKGRQCQAKPCGHPGDAQFADFHLDKGTDFVFGSRVVYTCLKGYQMQNRINYRNCMDQGWDGIVPICEAVTCPPLDVEDTVRVNGDLLQGTYGNVVQFGCKSSHEILSGSAEIYCDDTGMWSAPAPTCQAIRCSPPDIENGLVLGRDKEYNQNDILHFRCSSGFSQPDPRPSKCLKSGMRAEWIPTPICERTKCRLTLPPVAGTRYEPDSRNVFEPGETLSVLCGDKFWIVDPKETSGEVTCNAEGQWSIRPVCQEVTCDGRKEENVYYWNIGWVRRLTLWNRVSYSCKMGYVSSDGTDMATCTRDGWTPKPLCQEKKCYKLELPNVPNAEIRRPNKLEYKYNEAADYDCKQGYEGVVIRFCGDFGWSGDSKCIEEHCKSPRIENAHLTQRGKRIYKHREQVQYTCQSDGGIRYTATCDQGVWTGIYNCADIRCDRQDYPYADIDGEPQSEYRFGEEVDYICKNDYEGSFTLTCGRGIWIKRSNCTRKQCQKPQIENAEFVDRVKDTYADSEQVEYTCRSDSALRYTATCDRGAWSRIHTCTVTECEKPEIENGFSVGPYKGKLYYTCNKDYKLFSKGGWGEATCADSRAWTGLGQCIGKTQCGEIPVIPNGNMTSREVHGQDERIWVICKEGFQALSASLRCHDGNWMADKALRNICQALASNCKPPPKFENAVVVAPPQKQYLTASEVTYECRSKFGMQEGGKLRCNNGKWENAVRCTPYCDKPEDDDTQSFTVDAGKEAYKNAEVVSYRCNGPAGENRTGTATCVDGKWHRTVACRGEGFRHTFKNISNVNSESHVFSWLHLVFPPPCAIPPTNRLLVDMPSSLILLLLQLWGGVQLSRSQGGKNCSECLASEPCSNLPVVPHGSVLEGTRKAAYQEGDVIHIACEVGYISGPTIRYECGAAGWAAIRRGSCYLKPCQLPENTPNGYYQLVHGSDFVFGAVIKYFCNEGYQMISRHDTRTCLLDNWTNHVPICEPLSCNPPPSDGQVTIKGLPEDDNPVLPDRFITFSCDDPGKYLNGSSVVICGRDGQWGNAFPTCEDIVCKVGVIHSHLRVAGLQTGNATLSIGHELQFRCRNPYDLDGAGIIKCLRTGEWSAPFPTCAGRCAVTGVPDGVRITTHLRYPQVRKGERITFACRHSEEFLQGKSEVECKGDARWSDPFPTCEVPLGCSSPPGLADGDIKDTFRYSYSHGEKVEYTCQNLFTMSADPFRTCLNGEWTGQMTCLKPCTVDSDIMRRHNIDFRHRNEEKLYATHEDVIGFKCVGQTRAGAVGMRQKCIDGFILLPTCS